MWGSLRAQEEWPQGTELTLGTGARCGRCKGFLFTHVEQPQGNALTLVTGAQGGGCRVSVPPALIFKNKCANFIHLGPACYSFLQYLYDFRRVKTSK